ncbi:storkhead-box protein 1-like [Xyrauchen texanus]|uniref:storkhead-box protein 1-like n=1 Tax=Xyrauchen texanus TaxID=154827 RepID=UPI002241C4E4|nr:storkhead-box protein 1-like [Xyrauchen texanus]
MSLQQRVVQLSSESLAVVLSRDEDTKHSATSASGQDVFADFKAQNSRSFWNQRLVKAVVEVYFRGWLENYVLVVQGNANNLEVLREAWMRRALRSPKGYIIKAVGDLSPVQMSPISQSQFIPLSEILCSVISDMNATHVVVNQEALINHMMKAHPGMTIPTQDILYNALGTLIKERKIYHTGEGYFVVTPQTYFITNNMVKERNWWITGDNGLPSPPPITYLVSNESCMETSTEVPVMAHCRSCSCFTPQSNVPPSIQDHQSISISECTGKSLKWLKEHKSSVQHQSTSTAADQASEISKSTTTSRKDKEKAGRKFGLNLFRRNTGKKENKLKKEYATFSGQFPPEEWPVRDEDDLNNLPRDLEHAIIKRINPELTVGNLVKHTVLMMKLEEKAERGTEKAVDRGISTEALVSKQRYHTSKVGGKKSVPRATRSKRRGHSSKEKHRAKRKTLPCAEDVEAGDHIMSCLRPETGLDEPDNQEEGIILNPKCVYKKRIENPFIGLPGRDMEPNIVHKEQRRREAKNPITRHREKTGHRSKSWDPHQAKAITHCVEESHTLMDTPCIQLHERALTVDSTLDAKPVKELCGDYGSVYPESSTLRIEDKIKLRENKFRSREFRNGRGRESKHNAFQDGDLRNVSDQKNNLDHPTPSCDVTEVPLSWPKPTIQRRLSLHLFNSKEESHHSPDLLSSHQQDSNMKISQQLSDDQTLHRNTSQTESDVYTDDEHGIYQKLEEDEDSCSSLCLNEECVLDCKLSQTGTAHCREPVCLDGDWDGNFIKEHGFTAHYEITRATRREHEYRLQSSYQRSLPLLQKVASPGQEAQGLGERLYKNSLVNAEPNEALESSIFVYSQTSEVDSDAETIQKSADEADGKSSHWLCRPELNDCHQNTLETSEDVGNIHNASLNGPAGACAGETAESQSNTADSGIDSPRTHISLISSNSAIIKGLKHRAFLQNLEKLHSKSNGIRPQNSLLKLTPVMNV